MNIQEHNFLSLLRYAVHGGEISLQQPVDYGQILAMARAHNLQALVGEMLCQDTVFLSAPEYEDTVRMVMGQVNAQAVRTDAFLKLYRRLSDAGIYPIVMKGLICRQLYGEYCDHRPSSDEDVLVRQEEFGEVQKVLETCCYRMDDKQETVTEKQLEKLQEITFHNEEAELYVEVHTNPIGLEYSLRRKMNDYFQNVFDDPRRVEIEGTEILTMNHTDHFLFLVLHAFKHMMTSGFGIRQVLDILLYQQQYGTEIDWTYIYRCLEQISAKCFYTDIITIGNRYLGFSLLSTYQPNCPEDLLEDLLSNGAFGNTTQAQLTAIQMTWSAIAAEKKSNKLLLLIKTIFPSKSRLMPLNPELADKPWLLPVCWVKRWGRFLKHNRQNGGNLAAESMAVSERRMELLRKYKIL